MDSRKIPLERGKMTHRPKLFLIAAIACLSTIAYAAPLPAPASAVLQPGGYGQGQIVTCSSDDGKRNYCNIDTRYGIQLTRQISGSPCVQNSTWGYDNRGLWVDQGCRAEFSVGGYGGNQLQQGQGQTITCSSNDADDSKPHYCNIDTRGGIQLTRQISGSPCIQGQTWGYDNQRVWVSRGCRAEFSSGAGGNGYGQGYGGSYGGSQQGQIITCSSDNGKRNWCPTSGLDIRNITMTRQISGSVCRRNYSWGVDRSRGLWVDHGCRAEFSVGGYGGNQWRPGQQNQGQIVTCSSDDGKRNWCAINGRDVRLTRQISGSPCVQGQTWDVDRRGLWVDNGCRAEFRVR